MSAPESLYDQVPYDGLPQPRAHPSALSAMARVFGLRSPPVERCRVLELGCGSAGNLISIALTLPGASCVGLDLSETAIARGRSRAREVGLENLTLSVGSILDVSEALGRFDYILCHGVFSWVPPVVQDALLRACHDNLEESGVAFVSYNTYPGWHLRAVARDLMRYHIAGLREPAERVGQARAVLELARRFTDPARAYRAVIEEEAREVAAFEDWYLLHDSLAECNTPIYFQDFVERARAAGLQYIASDRFHRWETRLPAEVAGTLGPLDRVRREQYLDFLFNKTFRRSLLCHAGIPLAPEPLAEPIPGLWVSADAVPRFEAGSDAPDSTRKFHIRGHHELTTNHPLLSAALDLLAEAAPATLSFGQLAGRVAPRVPAFAGPEDLKRDLSAGLLLLFRANAIDLWTRPFDLLGEAGERPRASPLARLEAREKTVVTNLKHQLVEPEATTLAVLNLCDGSRDREALIEALVAATGADELELQDPEGHPVREAAKIREVATAAVPAALSMLARLALLSG